jgi:hypothetical protein
VPEGAWPADPPARPRRFRRPYRRGRPSSSPAAFAAAAALPRCWPALPAAPPAAFDSVATCAGTVQRPGPLAAEWRPLELDEQARAALPQRQPTPLCRLNQVMDLVFRSSTSPPASPPAARPSTARGNCLLRQPFVGLARTISTCVEVTDYQKWSHQAGMVVSQGTSSPACTSTASSRPTTSALPPQGLSRLPPHRRRRRRTTINNPAPRRSGGDTRQALQLIETAACIAPSHQGANNLGVSAPAAGTAGPKRPIGGPRRARQLDRDDQHGAYVAAGRRAPRPRRCYHHRGHQHHQSLFLRLPGRHGSRPRRPCRRPDYMSKALRLDAESPTHIGL